MGSPVNPQWDISNAKRAVRDLALVSGGGIFYPMGILQSGNAPIGLVDFIITNYNSLETFAVVSQLPLKGQKSVSNYQFLWSKQQVATILREVARVEGPQFLPTNACLRERGLGWLEQTISGKSKEYAKLSGLRRSTFRERAAQRDRSTYHKAWTLPAAIEATRNLAAKLQTRGFMPTIKQFRSHRLNWLSCLISQKFGGIETFAGNCGLKLRRMSRNRKLRKPRHMLKRVARSKKRLAEIEAHKYHELLMRKALVEREQVPGSALGKRRVSAPPLLIS